MGVWEGPVEMPEWGKSTDVCGIEHPWGPRAFEYLLFWEGGVCVCKNIRNIFHFNHYSFLVYSLMALNIFTLMYNHYYHPSPEIFHFKVKFFTF